MDEPSGARDGLLSFGNLADKGTHLEMCGHLRRGMANLSSHPLWALGRAPYRRLPLYPSCQADPPASQML